MRHSEHGLWQQQNNVLPGNGYIDVHKCLLLLEGGLARALGASNGCKYLDK